MDYEVGQSLSDYLLNERLESSCHNVFLKRDGNAIGSASTISTVISTAFLDSEISIGNRHYGSHCLRHSLASAMLKEGISIFEIAQTLGHSSVDTTRIYTKVDLENLRMCGLEVPCYE